MGVVVSGNSEKPRLFLCVNQERRRWETLESLREATVAQDGCEELRIRFRAECTGEFPIAYHCLQPFSPCQNSSFLLQSSLATCLGLSSSWPDALCISYGLLEAVNVPAAWKLQEVRQVSWELETVQN